MLHFTLADGVILAARSQDAKYYLLETHQVFYFSTFPRIKEFKIQSSPYIQDVCKIRYLHNGAFATSEILTRARPVKFSQMPRQPIQR